MILASGCFDGIHIGHLRYLSEASLRRLRAGSELWVAVASDDYIRRSKGREPRWTQQQRMDALSYIDIVANVVPHGDNGVADAIKKYKPHLFVKGIDWKDRLASDVVNACDAVKCRIVFVDSGVKKHTSHALSA